ncbi:MAG: NAD(P)-dependent alcohol dehydrogenase [Sandaracinaceae bacterium]|nr:NAD(P)-dependent alcohol dehydrogenase [Sandaracinaceae bacterium]
MRAILCPQYGSADVLELREVAAPVPGPTQVRVRVVATTVTSGDWRVRSGQFPEGFGWIAKLAVGWSGPRQPILGTELSGVVESVGAKVTRFRVGDAVIGFPGAAMGAHAELCVFDQDGLLVRKPANLTFGDAAAILFGGTTALDVFRRAKLKAGERVLINGAAGGVGTAAVQLAKQRGAHVTAVCSTGNVAFVEALGADRVIDYRVHDFTADADRYDLVVDIAGTAPYARSKAVLTPTGRLALVLATLWDNLGALWVGLTTKHRVIAGPVDVRREDLEELARLASEGSYAPVVEQRFPFERIAEAHRVVDTGHKRGAVVVTLGARASER